jgi:hypothetical protein
MRRFEEALGRERDENATAVENEDQKPPGSDIRNVRGTAQLTPIRSCDALSTRVSSRIALSGYLHHIPSKTETLS